MKIVSDANIFGVVELFGRYGDVKCLSGREIRKSDIIGAEALLVRTTTQVNRELLDSTPIQFVGSATSGIDHIDMHYLATRNIQFAHSPGNNANAVVQYDLAVFATLKPNWRKATIGIIGCGKVGGRLYCLLKELNVKIQVYDPFLYKQKIPELTDLDTVLASDIICIHTPLTHDGEYPTIDLLDEERVNRLLPGALLVNAGRGEVLNEDALARRLESKNDISVALDVWNSEPIINLSLMEKVDIATPHIAGYTFEAKKTASLMLRDAFLLWQGIDPPANETIGLNSKILFPDQPIKSLNDFILACYDVSADDKKLRQTMRQDSDRGHSFERLRSEYSFRHDFKHYSVLNPQKIMSELNTLGFQTDRLI